MSHVPDRQTLDSKAVERVIALASDCDPECLARLVLLRGSLDLLGSAQEAQLEMLARILGEDYNLSDDEQEQLDIILAQQVKSEQLLDDCVAMLRHVLNLNARMEFISQLWELILSDGHFHQLEGDYVLQVGRAIDLTIDQISEMMTCQ